jgi:tetratricopeptide (TPR) repeat protein
MLENKIESKSFVRLPVMSLVSRRLQLVTTSALVVLLGVFCLVPRGQSQGRSAQPGSAIVSGQVTDAQGHPVAGALVRLSGNSEVISARTNSDGKYSISVARAGTYTGHAESESHHVANFGPLPLADNQLETINIVLPAKAAAQQGPLGTPDFFDEPRFTIAGVADTTNLGGHASGMAGPSNSLAEYVPPLSAGSARPADSTVLRSALDAAKSDPNSFDANYRAGNLLLHEGSPNDAVIYLQRASNLKLDDYQAEYDLAQAYCRAGMYDSSRSLARKLLAQKDTAALHHLLAEVQEKSGHPLDAVKEYQDAAKLDPGETNLLDWGAELLAHHAIEPAIEVFQTAATHFPQSPRVLTALGVALYEHGSYDEALRFVCQASDLNAQDPAPYLLLGKMQNGENSQSEARIEHLKRFAKLQPENPWANYYYALALWDRRKGAEDVSTSREIESRLQKAVHLDPKLAKAYFQLGALYSERKDLSKAIAAYQAAIQIDSQFEQAHYRLAQAYMATGQKVKAQEEITRYKEASTTKAERMEKERKEVQQFVYTMHDQSSVSPAR